MVKCDWKQKMEKAVVFAEKQVVKRLTHGAYKVKKGQEKRENEEKRERSGETDVIKMEYLSDK